jgi:hypothetical protein
LTSSGWKKSGEEKPVEPTMLQIKQLVSDGEGGLPAAPVTPNLLKYKGRDKVGREIKKDVKNAGSSHDIYENKG